MRGDLFPTDVLGFGQRALDYIGRTHGSVCFANHGLFGTEKQRLHTNANPSSLAQRNLEKACMHGTQTTVALTNRIRFNQNQEIG